MPITQTISVLENIPSIADIANFEDDTNALLNDDLPALITELNTFGTQATALEANVNAKETLATNAANAAVAAETVVSQVVAAAAWNAATNYALNANAISQINFQTYRRIVAGVSATDPKNDAVNWTRVITAQYNVKTAPAASDLDMGVADFFAKTIAANTTFTVSRVPAAGLAASFVLDLTNGGAFVITWWAGVKWAGGSAPNLTAAGRDVLGFYTHDGGATWTGLLLGKDVK